MATSISLAWSGCHVVTRHGGWWQLVGVPATHIERSVVRLSEMGAMGVSARPNGVISFQCPSGAWQQVISPLVAAFPCSPWLPVEPVSEAA
jgi:hypothetical protein